VASFVGWVAVLLATQQPYYSGVIMLEIEYMTDENGQPKAVVIPIELWKQLLPNENLSVEELSEKIENYCLK
jgi:hypothetical protein